MMRSERREGRVIASLMLLTLVLGSTGCASSSSNNSLARDVTSPTVLTTPDQPGSAVIAREPWTYAGAEGELLITRNFLIHTTERDPAIIRRLPIFLEAALLEYRFVLTPTTGPLPAPPREMPTYLFANRGQWVRKTQELLGPMSGPYLRIQRGGFASAGRAVLFDLGGTGAQSTFAVASHEGWHQYTQSVFREPLPIWLEEGLATFMEGHRWDGPRPVFLPWLNLERFDELRRAHADRRLVSITELLNATPAQRIGESERSALAYYAQVWTLVHFLREGENGKYAAGLEQLVRDAAEGKLSERLSASFGSRRGPSLMNTRRGPAVFMAYFGHDMAETELAYTDFINKLLVTGSRNRLVQGVSPIDRTN